MNPVSEAARRLHDDCLVVEGLIAFCDGYTDELLAGGVAAANVTVVTFQAGFEQAAAEMGAWHARLAEPGSKWRLVRGAGDVRAAREEGRVGLIMGWQNLRPIDDSLERLALFHAAGLRVAQLTYNERNLVGDGCLEPHDGGLSAFGRKAVAEMERLGVAIDLSHVAERTTLDTVAAATGPVLITHANAKAVSPSPRNKSDEVIRAVAETGGVVGASVHGALCWKGDPARPPTLSDALDNFDHIAALIGPERMSIGTDFITASPEGRAKVDAIVATTLARYPGFVSGFAAAFGNDVTARYPKDCPNPAHMAALTQGLLDRGWTAEQVRGVLGENLMRVLGRVWRG